MIKALFLPDGTLELKGGISSGALLEGGGLSAGMQFVPPWLQAAGRRFHFDQFLCREAFPRLQDVADVMAGEGCDKRVNVIGGDDKVTELIALSVEVPQGALDDFPAFRHL